MLDAQANILYLLGISLRSCRHCSASVVIIGDAWNFSEMWGCPTTGFGHAVRPSLMADQSPMAQKLRLAASNDIGRNALAIFDDVC